jgi:hypothetical protein
VSIITLPAKWMRSGATPSRRRFSSAAGSVMKSSSETASVRTRLTSSGMLRSKLRSPASTCATGIPSLTPARVAARVDVTSPTTSSQSGRALANTASSFCMISASWPTEPSARTARLMSGSGISRLAKNDCDICTS